MKRIFVFLLVALASTAWAQQKKVVKPAAKPMAAKYGALAVDRSNGFYYGWSYDQSSLAGAESRAVDECAKKGGNCTVVLSFAGAGCAAYRTIDGEVGTAFGWGLAKTKEQADAIATAECLKRSLGKTPSNFVWTCNSQNAGTLKEIYNANEEIASPITIGNQVWMNKNLDVGKFRNGDPITEAKTPEEWERLSSDESRQPAWCYYNFDPANAAKYGRLYNFYAVADKRGLAPAGWHIPSKAEYETLINHVGGEYTASKKLRSKTGFKNGNNGTNESGFNIQPAGFRGGYAKSGFSWIGESFLIWSSSVKDEYQCHYLAYNRDKDFIYVGAWSRDNGFSVRLIKNKG
ncbi:FISUMP domain-containing protein [Pedobacter sp. KR3-3]|uniref:FISUMP domain-containing protein n=1 Tax=Pedobacter albus TaxID=3113905 RepID=A0ABU7ICT8_9SPHI|nr:FISUMP domain-containing protein [Pedobacter sp. KR3-3]MEE1946989.1 FISUMP domain-containing protein [Pedobacter sp. KR3-3]